MLLEGLRVLVVGSTGFIGSHLCERLAALGSVVVGVSRHRPLAALVHGWSWERCDAASAADVDAAFERHQPEVVYQLTSDNRGGRDLNLVRPSVMNDVVATTNVLVASAEHECDRVIMTASLEEPDGSATGATPVSPYAAAKFTSGCYARMFSSLYELPVVTLRPMMGYGPRQKADKLIPYTIRTILEERPVEIHNPDRLANWVYIDDLVDAFVLASTAPLDAASGTHDVGSTDMVTNGELVTKIARLLGRDDLLRLGAGTPRSSEVVRAADVQRTAQTLGWAANTSLDDGLRRTIAWYESTTRNA